MKPFNPLILIPIILCLISSIGISEIYLHRLVQLNQCKEISLELSIKKLSLRRHEKDFFFRKQDKYLNKWQQTLKELKKEFDLAHTCFSVWDIQTDLITQMKLNLKGYESNFIILTSELNKSDKQSLSMLNSLMALQERLEKLAKIEDNNIYAQTLAIRQHLLEYITSKQAISLQLLIDNVMAISQWQDVSPKLKQELEAYLKKVRALKQFIESHQYSYEAGTMGQMRSDIHKIEEILPTLTQAIDVKIINQNTLRWLMYLVILLLIYVTYRIVNRMQINT